jgi:protein phosphatase
MTLSLRIGQHTVCGVRQSNEDAIAVEQFAHATVCLVADGMGGQGIGAEVSRLGINVIAHELKCHLSPLARTSEVRKSVRAAVVRAHEEVVNLSVSSNRRCGSTIVVAVWRHDRELYLTHLGDSRAYRQRGLQLEQLTLDDSVAYALVKTGTITPEQAAGSSWRIPIYRFLGAGEIPEEIEMGVQPLEPGDYFLLSTDGLHKFVSETEIASTIRETADTQKCAERLCQLALDRGSKDNVSCVVIEVIENAQQAKSSISKAKGSSKSWLHWNDSCVVKMARAIRDGGRFEDMPVLGDALEDAGCPDAMLVGHCREPGTHLPGCWALAALLQPPQG